MSTKDWVFSLLLLHLRLRLFLLASLLLFWPCHKWVRDWVVNLELRVSFRGNYGEAVFQHYEMGHFQDNVHITHSTQRPWEETWERTENVTRGHTLTVKMLQVTLSGHRVTSLIHGRAASILFKELSPASLCSLFKTFPFLRNKVGISLLWKEIFVFNVGIAFEKKQILIKR